MATTPSTVPPWCGGIHYRYRECLGEPALTINHKLAGPFTLNCRSINQTRAIRVVTVFEGTINKCRDDITNLKFNGNLDTDAADFTTDLNKIPIDCELS